MGINRRIGLIRGRGHWLRAWNVAGRLITSILMNGVRIDDGCARCKQERTRYENAKYQILLCVFDVHCGTINEKFAISESLLSSNSTPTSINNIPNTMLIIRVYLADIFMNCEACA